MRLKKAINPGQYVMTVQTRYGRRTSWELETKKVVSLKTLRQYILNREKEGSTSTGLTLDHSDSKEFPHILFSHYNRGVLNETMISWYAYTDEREG